MVKGLLGLRMRERGGNRSKWFRLRHGSNKEKKKKEIEIRGKDKEC